MAEDRGAARPRRSAGPAAARTRYPCRVTETTTATTELRPAATRSIDGLQAAMGEHDYVADRALATVIFLGLELGRPILFEGEAGVGKTEVAKVLASMLGSRLIRLQCYEGLDVTTAVYEWNYPRQMLEIRLREARGETQTSAHDIFGPDFLIRRPLLQALESTDGVPPVLLIDEIDRADEEFEAYLLEILSDFQVTVPESAHKAPTHAGGPHLNGRVRSTDALKRRCLYHWNDTPPPTRSTPSCRRVSPAWTSGWPATSWGSCSASARWS